MTHSCLLQRTTTPVLLSSSPKHYNTSPSLVLSRALHHQSCSPPLQGTTSPVLLSSSRKHQTTSPPLLLCKALSHQSLYRLLEKSSPRKNSTSKLQKFISPQPWKLQRIRLNHENRNVYFIQCFWQPFRPNLNIEAVVLAFLFQQVGQDAITKLCFESSPKGFFKKRFFRTMHYFHHWP